MKDIIIDLNIENYSIDDIYHLFKIENPNNLDEEMMKLAKRMVLLTHPDKSKLNAKYFLFYCNAYKRLYAIYEFQNKSKQSTEYENVLESVSEGETNIKAPIQSSDKSFHIWFNEYFEKNHLKDEEETAGYEEWYKSNSDVNTSSDMKSHKRNVQSVTLYNGYNKTCSNASFGGKLMNHKTDNFTSAKLFDSFNYTDLKQAYEESVFPVTEEDFDKIPKYKNVDEYKQTRESMQVQPMNEKDALKVLEKERDIIY
jgi:hypothetical protein